MKEGKKGEQTKLDQQNEIMVKHSIRLSDKKQRPNIKGSERQDKIKEDPSWAEKKGYNFTHNGACMQQGVREEKEEGERCTE